MTESMISLKLSKKEKETTNEVIPVENQEYPWGLGIILENDTLDKLDVKISDYKVGEEVIIEAKCKITRISQSSREKGKADKCIDLQITDMFFGVEDNSEEKDDEDLSWEDDRKTAEKKMKK